MTPYLFKLSLFVVSSFAPLHVIRQLYSQFYEFKSFFVLKTTQTLSMNMVESLIMFLLRVGQERERVREVGISDDDVDRARKDRWSRMFGMDEERTRE